MSRSSPDLDPAVDAVAERLVDIGRHLREARQQRGEDLYDVADYLRIKPSYLFALEEGDLAAMPGRTYAMGFLRTYADHLGYDGTELVRGLNVWAQTQAGTLKVREPAPENRLPSLAMVAAALTLAGVAYLGWFAAQSGEQLFGRVKAVPGEIGQYAARLFDDEAAASGAGPQVAEPLEKLVAEDSAAASAARPRLGTGPSNNVAAGSPVVDRSPSLAGLQAREMQSGTPLATATLTSADRHREVAALAPTAAIDRPTTAEQSAAPGGGDDALAALALDAEAERDAALRRLDSERPDGGTVGELLAGLQPDPAGDNAAASDRAAGETTAATVSAASGRVVLLAREASWIQVQSPSRDYMRSTTLEPGQRFEIPDRDDLALWTGNAGGLEVWVDGRNFGLLGESGAVRRGVALTPEALATPR